MSDYLDVLRTAYQAAKAADPSCTVIGGIACEPGREWEDQFITQGGLQWCDVTNYHLYPSRQRAEAAEVAFKMRWEQMQTAGPGQADLGDGVRFVCRGRSSYAPGYCG